MLYFIILHFQLSLLIGATVAVLFSGYLTDRIGRKLSIIACSIIYTIGWLLIVLVVEFTDSPVFRILLFTGRFIVGLSLGWTSLCVNVSGIKLYLWYYYKICEMRDKTMTVLWVACRFKSCHPGGIFSSFV